MRSRTARPTIPLAALVVLAALVGALLAAAPPASAQDAGSEICEAFGNTEVGDYVVQNNRWGSSAEQCIEVTDGGFTVTAQEGTKSTSGAPTSYPSIFWGCHYDVCSPGAEPVRVSDITSAPTSIDYTAVPDGSYNAAYDIWVNADDDTSGVQDTEIMVWLRRQGDIQPIGSQTGSVTLAGRTWEVWEGSNGENDVVSYVAGSSIPSISFDVADIIDDVVDRGAAAEDWYLTSIQAGFEPWSGGAGLSVDDFSAAVNTGGAGGGDTPTDEPSDDTPSGEPTDTPSEDVPSAPAPSEPAPSQPAPSDAPAGDGECSAELRTRQTWNGGYVSDVVVTAGDDGLDGWQVSFQPGGTLAEVWGMQVDGARSGTVTADAVGWSSTVGAGQQVTAGFVSSGEPGPAAVECTTG